ncbi:MAG: alpha/beta fold hydrolase [Polyangia bacterium]
MVDADTQFLPAAFWTAGAEVSAHALRRPFLLTPEGTPKAGVLLIHGFTGTPFEMRLLGEALCRRGYLVYAPLLAGHGRSSDDLAATGWKDWYASVDAALTELCALVPTVCVGGLSLGGLLTLELARHRGPEITAIASLSAPVWLTRPVEMIIKITRWLRRTPPTVAVPKSAGSDIADPVMRQRNNLAQGAIGLPIVSVLSLRDFMDHVLAGLGDVKLPTLLMHARRDHTVPFSCLAAIHRGLGTKQVETRTLEKSFHVVTLDLDREQVIADVDAHFARHLSPL